MVVIQQELEKGVQVTDEIMVGRRPWKDLFTKHTFFTSGFRYYLTVIASSRTKKAQNQWSGFVESRVRVLVNKIEMHPSIALARPFNKGYDREHKCKNDAQIEEVVSTGSLAYVYKPPADGEEKTKTEAKTEIKPEIKPEIKQETKPETMTGVKTEDGVPVKQEYDEGVPPAPSTTIKPETSDHNDDDTEVKLENIPEYKPEEPEMEIYTTNHYIGLQLVEGARTLDLSREVNDWKAMCTSNELYDANTMFLTIQHVKNTALPDDVFEPGEVKPQPPVKKSLKRVASEDPRQHQPPAKRLVQGQGKAPGQVPTAAKANNKATAAVG